MSSQQPAFHFGGQAPNQPPQPQLNYAPPPLPANGTPVASNQPQQMAFQQNAALPGLDLSALKNINISAEQLMAIAHLLQSGQLTLPSPAPGVTPTPSAFPVAAAVSPSAAAPRATPPPPGVGDDANMDREEGELEDGEDEASDGKAHTSTLVGHSQSMTDRSVPAQATRLNSTSAAPPHSYLTDNTPTAPKAQPLSGSYVYNQHAKFVEPPKQSVPVPAPSAPQPSMAVKAFVLELHRVGYGFDDLAREVGNTQSLRNLYQQIGLPISPKPGGSLTTMHQSFAPRASVNDAPQSVVSIPPADTQRQTSGTQPIAVKPTATAPAKPDRASYLAKLQAAKNKKSELVAESPTANLAQSPTAPAAVSAQSSMSSVNARNPQPAVGGQQSSTPRTFSATASQPAATSVASPARAPKVTVDTELVRQRLAKLQAERAAIQNAQNAQKLSSDATVPDGSIGKNQKTQASQSNLSLPPAIATGVQPATTAVDRESTNIPLDSPAATSPSLARGSGLPGLFTTKTPVQHSSPSNRPFAETSFHARNPMQAPAGLEMPAGSPINSPAPLHPPRQRPMNGQQSPWSGSSASKRPFGESGMQNEAFIIETSSDDDDGEDMDTDDSTGLQSPEPGTKSLPARPVGLLPDFPPPKLDPQRATSTPGTPSIDLKRKLEEIEAAKQQLEALKRRKVSFKHSANSEIASMQSPAVAATARSSVSLSDAATPIVDAGLQSPSASAYLNKQQEKEALRKRLQELESSLGRKLQGASIAAMPTSEAAAQSAPRPSEEKASDATDVVDDDSEDDGDLYGSDSVDPAAKEDRSAPLGNVDIQDPDDEDGEIYEPQDIDSTGDTNMNGKTGSDATAHSATATADAATSQLSAEMDAATSGDGTNADGYGHTSSAQQAIDAIESDQYLSKGGDDIEDGEVADDDSEDMYEPSAVHPPQQSVVSNGPSPTVIEQEQDEQDEDNEAMDISSDSSDSDSSSDESSDDYEPEQNVAPESSDLPEAQGLARDHADDAEAPEPQPLRPSIDDDLAAELQPAEEQHVAATEPASDSGFYKPYTSMLSRFKEYRYHPDFIDNVSGGHQSLTYSNNIDPEKPICPFEIGGRCNDKDCQFQHFKTMTLSDNDLLREIGTRKIPAKGPEEEKKWRDGLTAVVKELRTTNRGKDVAVIAQRIAEYRRDFIGDPTKTLMLD